MSEKEPIHVFVTHLFEEDADYQRVFEYLESRDKFFYKNHANPEAAPGSGDIEAIKEELRNQIQPAEILILPVAIYEQNQDLVRFQMDVAQAFDKPILAIQSFGGTVAIQKEVMDRADDIVEWNDRVITAAIGKLARNEDAGEWEVVEFTLD